MNYIKELNAFRNWLLLHDLSSGAILLWHTLMSINNMAGWKTKFNANNTIVFQLTGLSKTSLATARKQLQDHGLIIYHKGNKGRSPVYQMVSLDEKMNQRINQCHDQFQGQSAEQFKDQSNPYQVPFEGQNEYQFWASSGTDSGHILKHKQKQISSSRGARASENPFDVYRKNFGILRPAKIDAISAWCRDLGDEIVIAGMKLAVKKGGQTLGYVEEILKEWADAKLVSMDQVSAHEKQKAENKKKCTPFPSDVDDTDSVFDDLRREAALS
jgi:DnaD/phage-associated family protein